ncbi:hypothetical protein NW766_010122 [Fusarium irregulare]|uniref:Glutathione S-transferase UstS-like C-terminal domain-containing protein n=1 Tax=Fusarium irregulare TaxID=2494466 RepID=A0A9W8U5M6_9HYPO|nr:hypothetical protein NW766_010122 [Fusarium irregulare]
MGSRAIAEALEKHSNLQPLRLEAKESAKVEQLAEKLLIASRPLWAHLLPKILTESNGEYYSTTRAKRFGMSLDLYYTEHVSQHLWNHLDAMCLDIGQSLAQSPGPYLLGQQPTYADFTVVALIKFFCCVNKAMADHFFLVEPRLRKLYEACYQWFKRDD